MKHLYKLILCIALSLHFGCSSDDDLALPLADFQFLVEGAVVTFNGTVANATSINWDFGDGNNSSEEDPVHAFADPGTYTVVMTASGANGSFSENKEVTILPSFEILLTGGPGRPEGKTWRLRRAYTAGLEGAGLIIDDLSLLIASFDNLLEAVGLGSGYDDSFTFFHDGSYKVDNKDGQSLMAVLFANVLFQAEIRAVSADINNVPLADVVYTPNENASWQVSDDDFSVSTLYPQVGPVEAQFSGKRRLILDEYIGFKDFSNLVIIKELTENSLNVAIAIHTEQTAAETPTLFFHLTLESL